MKRYTIHSKGPGHLMLALLATILSGILAGCELEETNINPNSPTEIPASVLLPFNQERLARLMGSTPQVMAGIFMQYYEGFDNHPSQVEIYQVNEALYVDWDWNDYYDGPMINLRKMLDVAEQEQSYIYLGIGKVLMALCLGNITSMWGDVPWSEALEGSDMRSPKFDQQESIYEAIQQLLDDAIADLQQNYEGLKPGSDDIIFGGDPENWIRTAYSLKARYYMHLTKRADDLTFNPAQEALDAIENGFRSNEDNMIYQFGYNASEYSPFYSFSRLNYIRPDSYLTTLMLLLSDPRRDAYFQKKFGVSTLENAFYTSPASPVNMMTYYEMKFIEAEARLRLNENDPLADSALREAVRANIDLLTRGALDSASMNSYLNAQTPLTGEFENKLERVIIQKYIAMYATIESWTDYRRTGFPDIEPNEGGDHNQNPGGDIPRRLTYPQTERLYNENFPEVLPTLQDRFWWDQE
jgi:hypothetical protein